jgi:ABC-2 type transport system permease protein
VLADFSRDVGRDARPDIELAPSRAARIDIQSRGWYNPTLNYKHYMVPGILVTLVTLIGMLLTAQNIAREKELGTLEQLNVTPITKGQFIAGKLLPFWFLALVLFSIALVVGRVGFGLPMRGSVPLVYFGAAIYLFVALGLGLWISTITRTQQQTMFVVFFIQMIFLLMSGLFTPIDSMPDWAQLLAQLNPVKHFVVIMRTVLVRGGGVEAIAAPLGVLTLFGVAVLTFAVRQYSKTTA